MELYNHFAADSDVDLCLFDEDDDVSAFCVIVGCNDLVVWSIGREVDRCIDGVGSGA